MACTCHNHHLATIRALRARGGARARADVIAARDQALQCTSGSSDHVPEIVTDSHGCVE